MKKHHRGWKREHIVSSEFHKKRRALFGWFIAFMLFLVLPMVGLGILFGSLLSRFGDITPRLHLVLGVICGLPLLMVLIGGAIGAFIFRIMGTPLANIMAAADAVAKGDLQTRLDEKGPGEFRRLAQSFNRMTEELEKADQQRRNLTADVAHELRTPLHILQGNLEGILDGIYQPSIEHIEAMLDETRMLSRLVDDLQTLSLVETGQLHFRMEPIDIAELLADVRTSFSGPVEAAGINLKVSTEGDPEDLVINGDAERLDQVLSNLMGNALRYTPAGGSIDLKAAASSNGIQISVQDTGVGIPAEDLPFIFERFWRGDKARQRQSGTSSGLGLAIAKQFIQAHGGYITAESEPDKGTTFRIHFPKDPKHPS
jgi:two-component system OmpR family sensor kinase/two-component system sensor histidine kinase BaeS